MIKSYCCITFVMLLYWSYGRERHRQCAIPFPNWSQVYHESENTPMKPFRFAFPGRLGRDDGSSRGRVRRRQAHGDSELYGARRRLRQVFAVRDQGVGVSHTEAFEDGFLFGFYNKVRMVSVQGFGHECSMRRGLREREEERGIGEGWLTVESLQALYGK